MTRSSSRIDPAARRLLSSIAGTRDGQVSAMALAHKRGAGRQLIEAGLLVRRGSTMASVAEDDEKGAGIIGHLGGGDGPCRAVANPATDRSSDRATDPEAGGCSGWSSTDVFGWRCSATA